MKEIDNIKVVESIVEAVTLLKQKEVLLSMVSKNKTFFVNKKDKVLVLNENSSYFLSFEDFKETFKDNQFVIFEDNESNFDFSRDDEYYGWKHK